MEQLLIREALLDDVRAIISLLATDVIGGTIDSEDPSLLPLYEQQFERIAQSQNETLYVAEIDGEVVGTFQTTISHSLPYRAATRCIVEAVQVRPDMRGKRIGEEMMNFAIEQARRQGAASVTLSSNLQRVDAHRFYRRLGFVQSHAGFKLSL